MDKIRFEKKKTFFTQESNVKNIISNTLLHYWTEKRKKWLCKWWKGKKKHKQIDKLYSKYTGVRHK